ncbi:hypothetical protein TRAPUB_7727 [Trametes pubescens]|uniref:MYND-type domain-containing protein n=1 Tax=Trametes pubescens TaxID=154538 RepID=A0A1M2V2L4_TRAPU|nr:hypothetical protein TRAPUB_7727 [Trametes pubescens]
MSHPLVWPTKYFFYAIGNTAAVCLTRNLPPEEHADILLLGCGDPRHVLYTVFSESDDCEFPVVNEPHPKLVISDQLSVSTVSRKLDFTCCDIDPSVLARNALLLSLVADNVPQQMIWNIFYHLYLDQDSLSMLRSQCKKLVDASVSVASWRSSPYGVYLRVSTNHTLAELRRHWSLYIDMQDLPTPRLASLREGYKNAFKKSLDAKGTITATARSAGPLTLEALSLSDQVMDYWRTGTTFTDPKQIARARSLNPTFGYSLAGEGCIVHYASDPLSTFHSAALFGNSRGKVRPADLVKSAQAEFSEWCTAFRSSLSSFTHTPRVRLCLAEATAFCRSLKGFHESGTLNAGVPIAQYKTQLLCLSTDEYVHDEAPATFNVIETSNLIDHIGLLNILIAAVPLLSPFPSSVLYTESLLFFGEDATKEFADLLYADIGTVGLLLDLCPIDYLSGFTSRSNTHELELHTLNKGLLLSQFHQVTTWKRPASCDSDIALRGGHLCLPPVLDSRQLGTLLFDMYHTMFEQEDSPTFHEKRKANIMKAIVTSNFLDYMRESFAMLLKLVRERLRIPRNQWLEIMDRFLSLEQADQTMPMNTMNRNDLYAHLHRQGVYTVHYFKTDEPQRIGPFAGWETVPPVVRVTLSVPREKITALESMMRIAGVETPLLNANVRGTVTMNLFSAVHVAWGRVVAAGTKSSPRVLVEEDPDGWKGTLPLAVSFCLPALLLSDFEPPSALQVRLAVVCTAATTKLVRHLGLEMTVFSASLLDEDHVFVVPEASLPSADFEDAQGPLLRPKSTLRSQIGTQQAVIVELDEQCEFVHTLASKVVVEDPDVKREFGSAGATPQITQPSPCCMHLTVAGHSQDVVFPFPVIGGEYKLRLARKSLYIEVVVPIAGPFLKPDGMKLNPFPVVGTGKALQSWNIHRLSLSRLPVLSPTAPGISKWLDSHVGSMLSTRERTMRRKHRADALMFVKDSIHHIFVRSTGIQGGAAKRVFALRNDATNNCDTVLFVSDVRFDLHSHTMVCDAYVLPLTRAILRQIGVFFGKLVNGGTMANVSVFEGELQAWKQLIPAFVERCRTWAHTEDCEYLRRQQVPLTLEMEAVSLCSCGKGKDVEGLLKVDEWRRYAPYVTRIAISPLFAVSYLETVGRDPAAHKCSVCRGRGTPKLKGCTGCHKVRYCSQACQKKDWPRHKLQCKA